LQFSLYLANLEKENYFIHFIINLKTMPNSPTKVETADRLNRNLGLLQSGSAVTIDISTPAGQKGKFRSVFIGFLPKQYVLIQYPDSNKLGNFSQFITKGSGITVRGLIEGSEGSVVGFISNVKQTLQIPSRMIVLDFPRSVSLQNLRSSMRIETEINAKVNIANEYWSAIITNVSVTGCQVFVNDGDSLIMEKNKEIEIIIESYLDLHDIKMQAEICSIKALSSGVTLGVQFYEKSKTSVTKLLQHAVIVEN
jgi:hypothetical protein